MICCCKFVVASPLSHIRVNCGSIGVVELQGLVLSYAQKCADLLYTEAKFIVQGWDMSFDISQDFRLRRHVGASLQSFEMLI